MNGIFVTFEGIDGSGKTTQLEAYANYLTRQGYTVCRTREPGGSSIGASLRELLLNTDVSRRLVPEAELLLFMADRLQHVAEVILPALSRGEVVLSDRYVDSTLAYQGTGRGLEVEILRRFVSDLRLLQEYPERIIRVDGDIDVDNIGKEIISTLEPLFSAA